MIERVRLVRFKRFADHTFDVSGRSILLAGPNNSGKTTLLHAISAWNLALQRWLAERGTGGGKRRMSVVLDEFTALPLREMNLLWLNRHTARRLADQKQPKPAPIYVEVVVRPPALAEESLTIEFMYANEKLVYIRPVKSPDEPEPIESISETWQNRLKVVHVPAFSGIGTQEPRHAPGMQNKLVGEGKPGEIVRNLLLEIWEKSKVVGINESPWQWLRADVERLFQCELLEPVFSPARPYIVCEFRPKANPAAAGERSPKLDIANAGSGFHQVLLLLSFLYSRDATVLLLDEPDAHLHFILQREIFDHLRSVAQQRGSQLLIGTHAEVLLSGAEPEDIISFIGQHPTRLAVDAEKQRLRDAMRQLSALDLLQADHVRAVMYVEDESDFKILREWSRVLNHRAEAFLKFPYVVPLEGKGNLDDARKHFQCLRLIQSDIRGICLLDRDAGPRLAASGMPSGLELFQWGRYEIENYLLLPELLKRFLRRTSPQPVVEEQVIDNEFRANFPANIDFLKDIPALRDLKASDFLVDLLNRTTSPLPKRDLYMLASQMLPEEVHPDINAALDATARIIPKTVPSIEANVAPVDPTGVDADE